ncbi:hypothetical protein [Lysinibacillus sphaericus]|uniref:hypothetical protein n=1 Tax=Lysinibacillus sphaericus TaxID=1421 RepID=UPI001910379C|nr:hypothetical protein [Lysinibacillus sphaericus]QPA56313.1 hypothetical protein INQ53_10135 [Lysinibacillus sphaericus]
MIMKLTFRLLSIILWFVVFIVAFAGITIVIQNKFNVVTIIFFWVIVGILVGLSLVLWNKSNKFNKFQRFPIENIPDRSFQSTDVYSSIQTKDISRREVPQEILRDMKMYYTNAQLENDLRILQESIELMSTTKNIDTFLSRSYLAHQTSLTIEQAIMAGVFVKGKFTTSRDILNLKNELLPKVLDYSYLKVKQDTSKLKTDKGKIGRYQKYLELLKEKESDLDVSGNYEDIIHEVKQEINKLSRHTNSS